MLNSSRLYKVFEENSNQGLYMQEEIIAKKIKFYTISALKIAGETGLGVE